MRILLLLSLWLFGASAFAGPLVGGVAMDPAGEIRPALLLRALDRWQALPQARRDRLVIVDFAKLSSEKRFYVLDLATGAVAAYRTAHGKGSDPTHSGRASFFTDEMGSNASSLGAYLTAKRYIGRHGLSLALKGLDPGNASAEPRAIVLHSAAYMEADFIARHGKPGRSFGCFVVEARFIAGLVEALEGGVLIYADR